MKVKVEGKIQIPGALEPAWVDLTITTSSSQIIALMANVTTVMEQHKRLNDEELKGLMRSVQKRVQEMEEEEG